MDRETRVFAESHFRGLRGRPAGGVGASPGRVDFIERPDSFSYADFFKRYLLPNVPCVFSSAFTEGWGSRRHWVTAAGKPDFEHLLRKYGEVVVPVANCGLREYNSNPKEQMLLRDYISYWKDYIQGGYSSPRGCLYLKDWHLCRDSLTEDVFTLPMYFSSDWLNEYWDTLDVDDYRFIYMGPAGTWYHLCAATLLPVPCPCLPLPHTLPYPVDSGRASLRCPVRGIGCQEEALRDCHGGLPYDVTSPALLDSQLYPMREHCSPPLEVTQEAGEMVFVPSGWHHQVHNLQELRAVQQEVSEWRDTMPDWHQHCQVIMRSCSGINFEEFYHFLKIIAERRLLLLAKGMGHGEVEDSQDTRLGPQQAAFDVSRIAEVLASVVAHPDFQRLDTSMFSLQPEELLQQLEEVMVTTASL
ncbi:2-oxoglutarate and iron-dependent oxygenase JMJD4 isoform X3 [Vulpes lagopus]|uniref:2-oxoglutarate and iron-dependent oxygenase JMJD4 isoform X3 n=1 Tax=Vulpes lagopus TaxID=494514 RepID=UPI001BC930D4|nr:2-oxoglutarate and iron-dependent oxygenase JMJD4 isoform X3 [Vulpes lagopus]